MLSIAIKNNKLNAGCGTHYAEGWVNTDVVKTETTKPDVVVEPNQTYPFEDNTFDYVFLGHVLEHIPWPEVPPFLDEMRRIATPDAKFLITGPDIFKTIIRWSQKQEPWHMVLSVLEHQDINYQPGREHEWWDGATHHWNCHHERVSSLLHRMNFRNIEDIFEQIPKNVHMKGWNDGEIVWPVVGNWYWHFAIKCSNNK
jgi:predicted SAM-dependent methyltransferase